MKTTKVFLGVFSAFILFLLGSCVKEVNYGSIQGIVTNSKNNEPIQGVNISLSPTGLSAVTGSDGRYQFNNLSAGNYTVQGVKAGYESNTKNISIVAGNVSSGDMQLTLEITGFRLNVEYLDFGTNFSSLNFKIINTSQSLPISWSITESMAWMTATPSSGNLNAGQEVVVMVTIDRDQIEQNISANLTVESGDQTQVLPVNVSVSGNSGPQPQLQLSETSLDFGTSATSLAFYVMNIGPVGTSLNWTCSNINVDWLMIAPSSGNTDGGSSTAVMATIDRAKIDGLVSTSVTISGAGSSSTISISAASEGAGAAILQLSEGSLDFGENETTKTFYVKNVGSAGTVLDWSIAMPSVDWLTLTPMTGNTNAGSGTQVTAVVDRNKINGMVSTTITVSGTNNSANLSVSAACFHPILEVPVTSVDFGKLSTEQNFEIKNIGDEGSVLSWSITDPMVDWLTVSPSSGSISASESQTITLTIDRTKFDGDVSTTIIVAGEGQSAMVNITASTPVAVMSVPVTSIDFGKVSSEQTFEIKNTGETGSYVNWSIATPSVSWLTVTPMAGSATTTSSSTVTLTVDRNAFVGQETTSITITGAGSTATVTLTVDNRVVVTDGLYAYFTFDSEEVVDWAGNFSGLNYGVLLTDDTPSGTGKSAQFDGEASYIYIPDNVIPGGVPYSFNIWFKTGRNNQVLFGTNIGLNYTLYYFGLTSNSCVELQLSHYDYWTSTNPITSYVNNQWNMLTFTYNGVTANYYINGILLETKSLNNLFWINELDAFYFGKHIKTSVFYGKLDNFRSYSRALTQNEVKAIFNAKQ